MRQAAQLKVLEQKKVSFTTEQLAFKMDVDDTGLFTSEQPEPITVSNAKGSRKSSGGRKRSTSAKQKPSGIGRGVNQLNKGRPKQSAKVSAGKPKPLPAWNDATSKQKYFDPSIDSREKRAQENDEKRQIREAKAVLQKAGGATLSVKRNDDEPGKFQVEFKNTAGTVSNEVEIYQNIDQLVADKQKPNYASFNYRLKPSPQKETSKRRKQSPEKFERKKHNVELDIAHVEVVGDSELSSIDDSGQQSHLKEYQKQARAETVNAIKGILKD